MDCQRMATLYLFFISSMVYIQAASLLNRADFDYDSNYDDTESVVLNALKRALSTKERLRNAKEKVYEPAPCQIIASPYGCCWDDFSIPKGPNGEGCPACIDKHSKCGMLRSLGMCSTPSVRRSCPESCDVGCAKKPCADKKGMGEFCLILRKQGSCKDAKFMKNFCRRTCLLCCK